MPTRVKDMPARTLAVVQGWLTSTMLAVADRLAPQAGSDPEDRDRGDVPGWVMITVMTAALVLAILVPFRAAIVTAVQTALDSVTTAG